MNYNGGRLANPVKNFGSTINGSLTALSLKQLIATMLVLLTALLVQQIERLILIGSLIMGAGNEITNSVASILEHQMMAVIPLKN